MCPPSPFLCQCLLASQHTDATNYATRYVNQYMVVDFNKFTPGAPLPPGTLWVVEEIPGLVAGGDQTAVLERGYFPSYNVPFYGLVYSRSGYAFMTSIVTAPSDSTPIQVPRSS